MNNKYNTEYICTYPYIFELLREMKNETKINEKKKIKETQYTEEEKERIQDISYKNDMLNIFFLSDLDQERINTTIQEVFLLVFEKENLIMSACCKELASRYNVTDFSFGFSLLFTYDYLDLMHTCLCELLNEGVISEVSLNKLKDAVYNK